MEGDVESATSSLENLEGSASEKQLCFYRAMTLYTHNLVECLQEKVRGHSKWTITIVASFICLVSCEAELHRPY